MVSTSCVEILNADDAGTYAAGTWVDYKALPDLKNAGLGGRLYTSDAADEERGVALEGRRVR